jgi:hypothetical protein
MSNVHLRCAEHQNEFTRRGEVSAGVHLSVFVHLIEYRIVPGHEAEVTGFLRHEALGGPLPDGMVARFAGRRLRGDGRRHIVATTRRDSAALAAGTDVGGVPGSLAGKVELLANAQTSLFRVVAATGG